MFGILTLNITLVNDLSVSTLYQTLFHQMLQVIPVRFLTARFPASLRAHETFQTVLWTFVVSIIVTFDHLKSGFENLSKSHFNFRRIFLD
eukprot:UN02335